MAKHRLRSADPGNGGFAMIIIAALFTAFAVVALVFLDNRTVTQKLSRQQSHQVQLTKLQSALTKFLLKEGRLPCPARYSVSPNDATMVGEYGYEMHPVKSDGSAVSSISDCSKAVDTTANWARGAGIDVLNSTNAEFVRGMVPFKALEAYGITEQDAYDGQGDRVMYIVNRQLTGGQGVNSTAANDFVSGSGATLGSATGYASEQATLNDKVSGKITKVDFLLVAYGADKLGGLGHDQLPLAAGIDCTAANANVAQKLLKCTITPTVTCPASNALAAQNCNSNLAFVTMPQNTGSGTAASATTATNKTYFDDQVVGVSVTCPNGTLTRSADGQCSNAYCWGNNSSGQLGNGTKTQIQTSAAGSIVADARVPVPVSLPVGAPSMQSIGVGESTLATVNGAPSVTVCGMTGNADGATYGAVTYGDVYCWGSNAVVAGGVGSVSKVPVQIVPSATMTANGTKSFKFTSIQVGYYSTCGMGGTVAADGTVGNDGNIYCWGSNAYGQLGNGTTNATAWTVTPAAVLLPGVVTFTSFSGDGTHWCALGSDANVYCWGRNDQGQLGFIAPANAPPSANIPVLADAVKAYALANVHTIVSIGSKGTTAYLDSGELIGWGKQWVPNPPLPGPYVVDISTDTTTLKLTSFLTGGAAVDGAEATRDTTGFASGGAQHQCVGAANSGVAVATYCRGDNTYGQLGNGATSATPSTAFMPVSMPSNVTFASISASDSVSCAIGSDGHAYCWGHNNYGQLGNKTKTDANVPAAVKLPNGVNDFTAIATGGSTTCALTKP